MNALADEDYVVRGLAAEGLMRIADERAIPTLRIAIEECQRLGAKEVCTEHVLLALLKEGGCLAHKSLKALGVTYENACADLAKMKK